MCASALARTPVSSYDTRKSMIPGACAVELLSAKQAPNGAIKLD